MSLSTQTVSPKAATLPPIPAEDPFTSAQWKTLLAIADAVIPAIKPVAVADVQTESPAKETEYETAISTLQGSSAESSEALAAAYLQESASSIPEFKDSWHRFFMLYTPQDARKQLAMVLNVLDTRAGSLLLTGYMTPIAAQPLHIRVAILQGWQVARLPVLRSLYKTFTMLTKQSWLRVSPTLNKIIGIPRVPTNMIPGKGFDYPFLQFPAGDAPEIIETDVVIVGSGCGGGVSARNLAQAGHKVLVVENGYHWTPDHFPMKEAEGFANLFMNGGIIASDDTCVNIIAGGTWGGGGTVNWSASLQTQGYVRREWAASGLPFFTSAEFQDCLDRVCERMGVSTEHIQHNLSNQKLMEGARRLGYAYKAVPQNTGGKQHSCGYCVFGCGSCEKQGPVVSFLPDAARAGATFVEGFFAEKVLFTTTKNGEKVASGVQGTWSSRDTNGGVAGAPLVRRKVIIKAKRVIVSAGTMQSPLLLLRSGLSNYHIGRNLYVHPVALVGGIHPEEVKSWEGSILTSVVSEHENLDGKGHGVKLEVTCMTPSLWLPFVAWKDGLDYKLNASRMKHMTAWLSIARDRDTGQVYPDPVDGRARFRYEVSKFDKQSILEGLVALAKIKYVSGASEIWTTIPGVEPFVRSSEELSKSSGDGINDARFQAWLDKVKANGAPSPDTMFASAHQMGTCRMSASPRSGVVDALGQVWGTKGLFVADASVFPSASGVNPMVTNMAISDWISRSIARGLSERPRL